MIIKSPSGRNLLIDCGSDGRHSLAAVGLTHRDISSVYISHLHADHAGGLEWLAFTNRFDKPARKPQLYIHPSLQQRLWDNVLSGGLQSIEGDRPARLTDFYEVMPLQQERFTWEGIEFELVKTVHVSNGTELTPSYGLYFATSKTKIFITTDTQFEPSLYEPYFLQADLIFHDCDTGEHRSPVHAHLSELATLPASIKEKMWLYHYNCIKGIDPKKSGFPGFVKKGQEFDI
ncbi:MBL fold metallo-hydrolase [Legionella sp. km772]|nr:MBL fold metallo-hydrolase [Legionella sp. km772]